MIYIYRERGVGRGEELYMDNFVIEINNERIDWLLLFSGWKKRKGNCYERIYKWDFSVRVWQVVFFRFPIMKFTLIILPMILKLFYFLLGILDEF